MRNTVRTLATVAVLATAGAAVAAGSGAVGSQSQSGFELSPPRISPAGPIVNFDQLTPGETRSADFALENANDARATVLVGGSLTSTAGDLYDILTARIVDRDSGQAVWEGGLRQMLAGGQLGRIPVRGTGRFRIEVGVPSWADSAYIGSRAEWDMNFTFAAETPDFDRVAPRTSIDMKRSTTVKRFNKAVRTSVGKKRLRVTLRGTARDEHTSVSRVEVSLARKYTKRVKGKRRALCDTFVPLKRRFVKLGSTSCQRFWITANGTESWNYTFPRIAKMPKGTYELRVRATDPIGNVENRFRSRGADINIFRYRVR